jgi:hypothetical protein
MLFSADAMLVCVDITVLYIVYGKISSIVFLYRITAVSHD